MVTAVALALGLVMRMLGVQFIKLFLGSVDGRRSCGSSSARWLAPYGPVARAVNALLDAVTGHCDSAVGHAGPDGVATCNSGDLLSERRGACKNSFQNGGRVLPHQPVISTAMPRCFTAVIG